LLRILAGPRRQRRRRLAQVAATVALALLLACAAGLALPDHDGITRAAARSHAPSGSATVARGPAGPASAHKPHPAHKANLAHTAPPLPQAELTIGAKNVATATDLPASFLGLSTEYWALPQFDRDMPVFERVLSLLHVPGAGPLVLRVGGDSADHSFWDPTAKKMPDWAFRLTPAWLKQLNAVVRGDGLRLIIDLNLITDTPVMAATWAHAADTSLPHGSLIGFEIGNEPDIYQRSYWLAELSRSPMRITNLPFKLTRGLYVRDFKAYAGQLARRAPGVPLIGPALAHADTNRRWISELIGAERSSVGAISAHMYPYSACERNPKAHDFPTVGRLLSEHATAGMAAAVEPAVRIAHAAGLPFRLTEINSVTCGGRNGVSNTFATALWAPDALFELAGAGVNGVNLHVRADAINAPFRIDRTGLYARPLLYGLLAFTRMLGPHAQVVRVQLHAASSLHLKAWATRVGGGMLHVLVIDKGRHSVRVDLHLPATGVATVQRLLASSPASRSGVTLDGQRLSAEGTWIGQPTTETIRRGVRGYELTVPRYSAALVGVAA